MPDLLSSPAEAYAQLANQIFGAFGLSFEPAVASFLFTFLPVVLLLLRELIHQGLEGAERRVDDYLRIGLTGAWVIAGLLASAFVVIDDPVQALISNVATGVFFGIGVGLVVYMLNKVDVPTDKLGLG